MEYGSIERQHSKDKNEGFTKPGIVDEGAKENIANTIQGKTELFRHLNTQISMIPPEKMLDVPQFGDVGNSMLSKGVNDLAKSIAGVADVAREDWRRETTNKLALKASAAQGTNIAIASMIEMKKRDPFMASVLGQTVTSRVAEAQSIKNATQQLYNTANEKMPQLAELTTEDAMEILASDGEKLVAGIKDPEMREIAMNSLLGNMPKLAQAHYEERYALMRNKQITNNKDFIIKKRISFEHDKNIANGPMQKAALYKHYIETVYEPNDPTGEQQDDVSKRENRQLVHAQAANDLKNGNKTLYEIIKHVPKGTPNELTPTEQEGFKDSIKSYDINRNTLGGQVITDAELGLLAAETPEEAEAAGQIAEQKLQEWSAEGTGSELDKKNISRRKVQLEKVLAKNQAAWAKNKVTNERREQLDNYYNLSPIQRANLQGGMTKDEQHYVSNLQIPIFISRTTGMPIDQAKQRSMNVLETGLHFIDAKGRERNMSPVTIAQLLVRDVADHGGKAPDIIQSFVDTQMQGLGIGKSEDGKKYSDRQIESFRVMEALVMGMPSIDLSRDDTVHMQIMRRGLNAGQSPEATEAFYKDYLNNKGLTNQSLIPRKERNLAIRSTVNNIIGRNVSDRVMSRYMDTYREIEQQNGFDKKITDTVFTQEVMKSSSVVQGLVVSNGRALDKALGKDYDLNSLLGVLSSVTRESELGKAVSLATPLMNVMFGAEIDDKQKTLKDISRVRYSNIEYIPGDDSVEFKVIGAGVTRIPLDVLRNVSKMAKVARIKSDFMKANDKLLQLQTRVPVSEKDAEGLKALHAAQVRSIMEMEKAGNSYTPEDKSESWLVRKIKSILN